MEPREKQNKRLGALQLKESYSNSVLLREEKCSSPFFLSYPQDTKSNLMTPHCWPIHSTQLTTYFCTPFCHSFISWHKLQGQSGSCHLCLHIYFTSRIFFKSLCDNSVKHSINATGFTLLHIEQNTTSAIVYYGAQSKCLKASRLSACSALF